jgi:hypothetical protein
MACILVLAMVLLTGLNKAVTGEGSAQVGTVRSFEDKLILSSLMQGMIAAADDHKGRYLVPSALVGKADRSVDTTASFFSALVMQNYVRPEGLISGNEYSGYVEPAYDYNYAAYNPAAGVYWDAGFKADLSDLSNVSFAHLPLFGERHERSWKQTFEGSVPILGNRGPRDGIDDPQSFTYGRNGRWAGHLAFGDGHVDFVDTFTPAGLLYDRGGPPQPDNIFAMEDGPGGRDTVIAFTRRMTTRGPELQYD